MKKTLSLILLLLLSTQAFAKSNVERKGYGPAGTDVALADGGTSSSLSDPNADRIFFWDDSASETDWLTLGTGLSITGTTINATASSSGWTDAGSGTVDLVTTTDTVNIGSDLGGRFNIDGSADEVQLWVQGHSTQTSNLMLLEASDGTDRFAVSNAGAVTITGSGTGALAVGNGATSAGLIQINEDTDDGSNNATITVPALAADTDYTLPADDGDSGEQLQTNGSGVLTWEAKEAITAGDYITRTSDDLDIDAEVITDTKCIWWENPVAGDDFKSIFVNDMPTTLTVTKLWCESDQTVTAMLQVDDGSAADMDTTDLVCVSTPDTDTSLDGDATIAAGDRVDIDVASVSGTPTWVSMCFTYTKAD